MSSASGNVGDVEEQTQTSVSHTPTAAGENQDSITNVTSNAADGTEESQNKPTEESADGSVQEATEHRETMGETQPGKELPNQDQEQDKLPPTLEDKESNLVEAEKLPDQDQDNSVPTPKQSTELHESEPYTQRSNSEPSKDENVEQSEPVDNALLTENGPTSTELETQKLETDIQEEESKPELIADEKRKSISATPPPVSDVNAVGETVAQKETSEKSLTPNQVEEEKGDIQVISGLAPHPSYGAGLEDQSDMPTPKENVEAPSAGSNQSVNIPTNKSVNVTNETIPKGEETPLTPPVHHEDTQPINLNWVYGINCNIPTINLSDENRTIICYAVAHVAVLFDYVNNKQKILQGHGNALSCFTCSQDKRWLATADKGPGSCVIVWDTFTCVPVQTIFDADGGSGFVALAISSDAKYIVTLSADSSQVVSLWDWTSSETPIHQIEINPAHGLQTKVNFHPDDNFKFVSNSESQILFYSWEYNELMVDAPFLSDSVFNRPVGFFSESIFQGGKSNRALTATSIGNIVVWIPAYTQKIKHNHHQCKYRPLKLVRIKEKGLTALSQVQGMVVAGDVVGHLRFFDEDLNLLYWFQNSDLGAIIGMSFSYNCDGTKGFNESSPIDATIKGNAFSVCDFVVSTKSAEVVNIQCSGTKMSHILQEHDGAVHAIAASPTKKWICIGSHAGLLKLWDYEKKKVIATRVFKNKEKVQSLAFNHNGLQIAIGFVSGAVYIADAMSLKDEVQFHYARKSVTHCKFSHDSKYFATADAECTTSVFVYSGESGWVYLGRYRAHYEPILDMVFGVDLDSNQQRLLTLGKDRVLVEYDLALSTTDDLKLLQYSRIEQSATPLCMDWYPNITKENFLVVSNNEYKMKLLNTTTKMCRKTFLGPTFGSPVKRISVVPALDPSASCYLMAYATENKVGLQLLPLDGNPHRSISLTAHPQGVSQIACSHDGNHIFTCGGNDASIHMWSINAKAMMAVEALGGSGLEPFYGLIEGGKEGEMFAELENYFYYAQLQSQGMVTTEERNVSNKVQLDQVPALMRALGFYPSEQQIEDIINEVKFSRFVETGEHVLEIDLADFIKLYINHRPAFGLLHSEIQKAFNLLCKGTDSQNEMDLQYLTEILQKRGEHMTEKELTDHLMTLIGFNQEGGNTEEADADQSQIDGLAGLLSDPINCNQFTNELLGLFSHSK